MVKRQSPPGFRRLLLLVPHLYRKGKGGSPLDREGEDTFPLTINPVERSAKHWLQLINPLHTKWQHILQLTVNKPGIRTSDWDQSVCPCSLLLCCRGINYIWSLTHPLMTPPSLVSTTVLKKVLTISSLPTNTPPSLGKTLKMLGEF